MKSTVFLPFSCVLLCVLTLSPTYAIENGIDRSDLRRHCDQRFFQMPIDHYNLQKPPLGKEDFPLRYFICKQDWWKKDDHGPIFFYCGNEANVELYLNNTGLMWENAQEYGALMIFAEHRYFGDSQPFGEQTRHHMGFLSPDQALADYATLLFHLKREWKAHLSPVIAFGGSYGGMLATWMRLKYPHMITGAIAGSAPVVSFYGLSPSYNDLGFYEVVTSDASARGGASDWCSKNIRRGWDEIVKLGESEKGRHILSTAFRLCSPLKKQDEVPALVEWASSAYTYLAMGSYPYPSSYILNGEGTLPAYPLRHACEKLDHSFGLMDAKPDGAEQQEVDDAQEEKGQVTEIFSAPYSTDEFQRIADMLDALRESVGVFHNATGEAECFSLKSTGNNETTLSGLYWSFLYCSTILQPFSSSGTTDMFLPNPFNLTQVQSNCEKTWGVSPRPFRPAIFYGGWEALSAASNIVFTNGGFDPWMAAGVTQSLSDSILALTIPEVGHHMDLMFSHPMDTEGVKEARAVQKKMIRRWIDEFVLEQKKKAAFFEARPSAKFTAAASTLPLDPEASDASSSSPSVVSSSSSLSMINPVVPEEDDVGPQNQDATETDRSTERAEVAQAPMELEDEGFTAEAHTTADESSSFFDLVGDIVNFE